MHELGIMTSVMDAVVPAAHDAGATRLLKVTLRMGEMREAIEDALQFAFQVLSEGDPFTEGAELEVHMVAPKSICQECGAVFNHDRFHMFCPECDSFALTLIEGREQEIESIEVDLPDDLPEAASPHDGALGSNGQRNDASSPGGQHGDLDGRQEGEQCPST